MFALKVLTWLIKQVMFGFTIYINICSLKQLKYDMLAQVVISMEFSYLPRLVKCLYGGTNCVLRVQTSLAKVDCMVELRKRVIGLWAAMWGMVGPCEAIAVRRHVRRVLYVGEEFVHGQLASCVMRLCSNCLGLSVRVIVEDDVSSRSLLCMFVHLLTSLVVRLRLSKNCKNEFICHMLLWKLLNRSFREKMLRNHENSMRRISSLFVPEGEPPKRA